MVDENIAGVVPVVDDEIQKKAKTARVLGFVAMGLSIVSIAMPVFAYCYNGKLFRSFCRHKPCRPWKYYSKY